MKCEKCYYWKGTKKDITAPCNYLKESHDVQLIIVTFCNDKCNNFNAHIEPMQPNDKF
jgi:hypothetical protein